jgi:hypothetical protein
LFAAGSDDIMRNRYKACTAVAGLGTGGAAPALKPQEEEQQRVRQFGFTAAEMRFTEAIVDAAVADVRAAAQRYFDKENYVQVVLKPEAGAQPATVASK